MKALELAFKVIRGIDYQTLSQYILKINQHKDIDGLLLEVSMCLKDILDYELFGFALNRGDSMDLWIDPRMHSTLFTEYVAKDFKSQNIDCTLHYFDQDITTKSHNSDAIALNKLISYKVMDGNHCARLYLQPRRKMMHHHDTIISTIIQSISIALEKNLSIQQLENETAVDPLTKCYNRRSLDKFIQRDIAHAQRCGTDLSVIMFDIDNFKEINDVYGHHAGDEVLKEISQMIPTLIRKSDSLARFGGDEFMLVLPNTPLYNAVTLAEKVRKAIVERTITMESATITVTVSFGVASLENKSDADSLMLEADERLYRAKSIGKNSVIPSLLPCFADKNFVSQAPLRKKTASARVA
jgi:diguanylate cyclase (GGDEF)-like protein